ncbi:MAG: SCO family protein [Candidatus Hydrogenedentes bacterium]|nr:SCO family protein [Candidatus Hydrogenedentota bacterium]
MSYGSLAAGEVLSANRAVAFCWAAGLAMCAAAQAPPPDFDALSFRGPDPAAQFREIRIEQRLDSLVHLDLAFGDEEGADVTLRDLLDGKPAVLSLVYYECPMLCNQVLNGVAVAVGAIGLELGADYNVLTVSIDPGEDHTLAMAKKASYIEELDRDGAAEGWRFLTVSQNHKEDVSFLASAVGFGYARDAATGQYAHAAGVMVLTPKGRVARYYYGIEYIPRDLEYGLMEASENRIGRLVDQIVLLCYAYDPATGSYGFYIIGAMRIGAAIMILLFAGLWTWEFTRNRRNRAKELERIVGRRVDSG